MTEDVLGLTAQIVSAHVTKNPVPVEELPALIREVYKTLSTVGEVVAPVGAPKPAKVAPPAGRANQSGKWRVATRRAPYRTVSLRTQAALHILSLWLEDV